MLQDMRQSRREAELTVHVVVDSFWTCTLTCVCSSDLLVRTLPLFLWLSFSIFLQRDITRSTNTVWKFSTDGTFSCLPCELCFDRD